MRQLNLRPLSPETLARYRTEEATATLALAALPAPANLPPDLLAEAFGPAATRFLFSVARQHQNQGFTFVELVLAGHNAVAKCVANWENNPDIVWADWSWWVRQGILKALAEGLAK